MSWLAWLGGRIICILDIIKKKIIKNRFFARLSFVFLKLYGIGFMESSVIIVIQSSLLVYLRAKIYTKDYNSRLKL